ncbi:hypothetical protein WJX77_001290 [Trebouxia sp. C0004]
MTKPVSPAEAALMCLQHSVVQASSTVQYINSAPPDLRRRAMLRHGQLAAHPVDKYCARPTSLKSHTFSSFYRAHIVSTSASVQNGTLVGCDIFGNNHFALQNQKSLVRFTDYHPVSQSEAFFFNILLQKVPFRDENQLLSTENSSKTYFEECYLRRTMTSAEDLNLLLQHYADYHLQQDESRAQLLITMLQRNPHMITPLGSPDTPETSSAPLPQQSRLVIIQDMSAVTLNVEQRAFVDNILHGATGLHLLTGGPGSGKTYVTKYLLETYLDTSVAFLATATTGTAATRMGIGASTVQTTFAILAKKLTTLPIESLTYERLRSAKVIIVDEASMLTATVFYLVMYRLLQVHGLLRDPEALLQLVTFILVGDHAQLSVVCYHRVPKD